jgi:hypothetical protein
MYQAVSKIQVGTDRQTKHHAGELKKHEECPVFLTAKDTLITVQYDI